ncbi:Hsp20/alpha crystallin family protein [Candidatus Parcubacteria bacterium]|nr:MAG: Hsp20/alpha crystallin family protein [Candidatus Parcubacteria bacterium]
MAQSFFERLTGSLRVREGSRDDADEAPAAAPERPGRTRVREYTPKKHMRPVVNDADEDDDDDKDEEEEENDEGEEAERVAPAAIAPEEEGELTVDIFDEGANIVVQSTVAGVKPEDVDISLEENTLTIRGTRERQHEVSDDRFYARELYWGAFSRSIILPEEVDFQKADASIRGGLLTIKLPKKERGSKKLKVKFSE